MHADLIAGLPGETLESFGEGFDRLVALGPQEIQVGLLKRLRGTPIIRHTREWEMVYQEQPPYEILQTRLIPFLELQRLRRFARFWDLIGNSGNFVATTPLVWSGEGSPFREFMRLTDWLYRQLGRQHGIPLEELVHLLFRFLTEEKELPAATAAAGLWRDYSAGGRSDKPTFLRAYLPETGVPHRTGSKSGIPKRQRRHLARRPGQSPE